MTPKDGRYSVFVPYRGEEIKNQTYSVAMGMKLAIAFSSPIGEKRLKIFNNCIFSSCYLFSSPIGEKRLKINMFCSHPSEKAVAFSSPIGEMRLKIIPFLEYCFP